MLQMLQKNRHFGKVPRKRELGTLSPKHPKLWSIWSISVSGLNRICRELKKNEGGFEREGGDLKGVVKV